jgi:hypothetical protein
MVDISEEILFLIGKATSMKRDYFILFILMIVLGCKLPKLSIRKQNINRSVIKTNGFYYNKPEFWSFMLYNNGIFRGDFGVEDKVIYSVIRSFTDSAYYKNDNNMAYAWGLFEINNDTINIEHWESREWAVYGITKYSGIILNDSTLLLDHPVVGRDTFYFHYLPIKPDSTNKFIKEKNYSK